MFVNLIRFCSGVGVPLSPQEVNEIVRESAISSKKRIFTLWGGGVDKAFLHCHFRLPFALLRAKCYAKCLF
jgi:hypothetical protein